MNDKAIEFEGIRFKTEKTITKLREVGLNVEKFDNLFNAIINECNSDTKAMPDSFNDFQTGFATDYMGASYGKAIKNLELLQNEMTKYEIYLQVYAFTGYIKTFIAKPNKTEEDFKAYRDSIIDILNKLLKSQTLDYDVEGNIVDEMYQITYYFILEELKFMGTSETLNLLIDDPTHVNHLDKQIHQAIETMNLKDSKYANLVSAMKQIDALGINSNYVNEDFLRKIVFHELDYEKITSIIRDLLNKVNDNLSKIDNFNYSIETNDGAKKTHVDSSIIGHICKNIALFITSGSIIAGMIHGSIKISKFGNRKYNNTTRTYSVSDGVTSETTYNYNWHNITTIYELTPYEKTENGQFSRTKTTYDVSKVGDIPLEEYLNLDLESLGIKGEEKTEKVDSLGLDDLYEDMIRYVKEITVDEKDYKDKINVLILILLLFLCTIFELYLETKYSDWEFNEEDHISFVSAIKGIIEDIKEIRSNKKDGQELAKEIKNLNAKVEELFKDNEQLIKRLEDYYQMIKDNPDYANESEKIEDTIKLVRRKMNSQNN